MKIWGLFRDRTDLWARVSLFLSIGFIVPGVILIMLGNILLEDTTGKILDQRLVIAELIANQIDQTFARAINELTSLKSAADFNPADQDLARETRAIEELIAQSGLPFSRIAFLDTSGQVLISRSKNGTPEFSTFSFDPDTGSFSQNDGVWISAPWMEPVTGNLATIVAIPVFEGNRRVGWLGCVVELNAERIRQQLLDAVSLDHTAHAILVDSQGRSLISTFNLPFLSPGEHHSFYRQSIAGGEASVDEVLFELDLPGEPVGHHHIMAIAPLNIIDWGVAIGGDVIGETLAGPYQLYIWAGVILALAALTGWGLTYFSTRKILEPVKNVHSKVAISNQLVKTKSWDELTSLLVEIPSYFLPVARSFLLVKEPRGVKLAAEWHSENHSRQTIEAVDMAITPCATCPVGKEYVEPEVVACSRPVPDQQRGRFTAYCLPLQHQDKPIGVLQFWLPETEQVSKNEADLLKIISTDMGISLESAILQRSIDNNFEFTQNEQKRIYRRLHDTLGQNISFLRLKLDQYSSESGITDPVDLRKDLDHMRDIAYEAYEQLRNMLQDLHPSTNQNLEEAIAVRGLAISQRGNFEFALTVEGDPLDIPQNVKRNILFICYEALNNIEKHARAKNVRIHLLWSREELSVTIKDDGVGFNRQDVSPDTHFGLNIMQDRAVLINGKLNIRSELKRGTEITFWLPLETTSVE